MATDSSVTELDPLLAEYRRLVAAGDQQSAETLLRQHAELAESIRPSAPQEDAPTETRDDDGGFQLGGGVAMQGEVDAPLSPTRAQPFTGDHPDDTVQLGRFGDFDLLEKIARGGMGLVFKARQLSLNRIVALKTIRHGRYTRPQEIKRFRTEAQAAAILNHPNIVPVYEIGEIDGVHYYTMQFVDGPSLGDLIRRGPLGPQIAARFVRTIARTMDDAHQHRVVHRDLKPSNILIDPTGQPRITDFGVAKILDDNTAPAAPGPIVGTPSYMSPEQSRGDDEATAFLSDIYSIGAVLYAILTARPPFQAETDLETVLQLRTSEPVEPRLLNPGVPRDLQSICLKCLQKDPQRRYVTAGELADDLDRFLTHRPTVARPAPRWERAWRTCRRNPVVSALSVSAVTLALALIVLLVGVNDHLRVLNDELRTSKQNLNSAQLDILRTLQEAEENSTATQSLLYAGDLKNAGQAYLDGDARELSLSLNRHLPEHGRQDLRGGEWYFLDRRARLARETIAEGDSPIYFACCLADGTKLLTAGRDAVIRAYDVAKRELLLEWPSTQVEVNGLRCLSNGRTLASAGDDGSICVWSIDWERRRTELVRRIQAHAAFAYNVLCMPDGQTLISAGRDSVVRLWNLQTGEARGVLDKHGDTAGAIALSSDGRRLASGDADGVVIVWNLETLEPTARIETKAGRINALNWSPDGNWIATASQRDVAEIWNADSGERQRGFSHLDAVLRVVFTLDQAALVTCDSGGIVHMWPLDAHGGAPLDGVTAAERQWKAHRDRVYGLELTPDGQRLITSGSDGAVSSWNLRIPPDHWTLAQTDTQIECMAFLPNNAGTRQLATVDGARVELWDASTGARTAELHAGAQNLRCLASSTDGRTLAAAGATGHVVILDALARRVRAEYDLGEARNPDQLALAPDGSLLAVVNGESSDKQDLWVMETSTGKQVDQLALADCDSAVFSNDGRWLITSGPANSLVVWDLSTRTRHAEKFMHVNTVNGICFSRDGAWAATASDDRLITLWDSRTWTPQPSWAGHRSEVNSVAFSHDVRTLASGSDDGRVKFWNMAMKQQLFEIDWSPSRIMEIAFSDDGRLGACLLRGFQDRPSDTAVRIFEWYPAEAAVRP